jgi:hypothetical protein
MVVILSPPTTMTKIISSSSKAEVEYSYSRLESYLQRIRRVESENSGHLEGRKHGREKRRSGTSTGKKENRMGGEPPSSESDPVPDNCKEQQE